MDSHATLIAEIAKLKADIAWMDEDGDVGDALVADVVADNKRLKIELAEAAWLIENGAPLRLGTTSESFYEWRDRKSDWQDNNKEAKP